MARFGAWLFGAAAFVTLLGLVLPHQRQVDVEGLYAVIAGVGLSNDVEGNLLAPASEGQLRAMREAYRQAQWSPSDVDLIECHATGTPVGDAVADGAPPSPAAPGPVAGWAAARAHGRSRGIDTNSSASIAPTVTMTSTNIISAYIV